MLTISGIVIFLLMGIAVVVYLLIKFKPYPIDLTAYLTRNQDQEENQRKEPQVERSYMAMSNLSISSSSEGQFTPTYPNKFDRGHRYKYGQRSLISEIPISAEPVCVKRTYFEPSTIKKQPKNFTLSTADPQTEAQGNSQDNIEN